MNRTLSDWVALIPPEHPEHRPAVNSPGPHSLRGVLSGARLGPRLAMLAAAHLSAAAVMIGSFAIISRIVSGGSTGPAWLGWVAALLAYPLLVAVGRFVEGRLLIDLGLRLKRLMLDRVLDEDPDSLRRNGVGASLVRGLEAEAVDELASDVGPAAALAGLDLLIYVVALAILVDAPGQAALLAIWLVLLAVTGTRLLAARRHLLRARREITTAFVEATLGHRTLVVQAAADDWARRSGPLLDGYHRAGRRLDRVLTGGSALVVHGYVVLAIVLLVVSGRLNPQSAGVVLLILLAASALERLWQGLNPLSAAYLALQAAPPPSPVTPRSAPRPVAGEDGALLEVRDLDYSYPDGRRVLTGCSVRIEAGERVLLTAPPGGGKSTFAAVIGGARRPRAGTVLLAGQPAEAMPLDTWRTRVAVAPQHHENHLLTGSLAFNLLLGRPYPHSPEDLAEALAVATELGLADLLKRMPAGMHQIVGETGWRLSHGERGMVYVARALVQRPDIVVIDECLAALDRPG